MKRITVHLPEALWKALKDEAHYQGLTMNGLIVAWLLRLKAQPEKTRVNPWKE